MPWVKTYTRYDDDVWLQGLGFYSRENKVDFHARPELPHCQVLPYKVAGALLTAETHKVWRGPGFIGS